MVTTTEMRASNRRSPNTAPQSPRLPASDDGQAQEIIQVLGSQLDQFNARIQRLQTELVDATTERQNLVDALSDLLGQSNSTQMPADTQCDVLLSGDEELRVTKQALASLQEEIVSTRQEHERSQADNDEQDSGTNNEVSAGVEADYRDALLGMESALRDREAAAAELEKDKAELFRRIMTLERRCAELDGLRADRESACAELRQTLADRTRQVERMNKYVIRVQRELKILNDEIHSAASGIRPLDGELLAAPDEVIVASAEPPEKPETSPVSPVTQLRPVTSQRKEESPVTEETQACRNDAVKEGFDEISVPEQFIVVPLGDDVSGPQYPLSKNELTIGRSRDHDIALHERHVSRDHARIIQRGFKVFIEDMGSKYGLLVNSEPKERHELKHGDRFTIGRKEFELVDLAVRASGLRTTPAA